MDAEANNEGKSTEQENDSTNSWEDKINVLIDQHPLSIILVIWEECSESHETSNEKVIACNHKVHEGEIEEHKFVEDLEYFSEEPILSAA